MIDEPPTDAFEKPRWQLKAERRKEKRESQVVLTLSHARPHPLSLFDIQNFVLWVLSDNFGVLPRWCLLQNKHLIRDIHCLVLSPDFEPVNHKSFIFERSDCSAGPDAGHLIAPFFTSVVKSNSMLGLRGTKDAVSAFMNVPLPAKALLEFESLRMASEPSALEPEGERPAKRRRLASEDQMTSEAVGPSAAAAADATGPPAAEGDPWQFVLTQADLRSHRYPQPLEDGLLPRGFLGPKQPSPAGQSGDGRKSRTRLLGVDCEMVQTEEGLELARVSVVDEKLETLVDLYVRPTSLVTDYLTRHSGITAEHLKDAVSFTAAQQAVVELLQHEEEDVILVGHSLENDLNALKIVYDKVIDTSVMYPHPRGLPAKNSLAMLALKVVNVRMDRMNGHCSADDASITMQVALKKIARGPSYNPCMGINRIVHFAEVLGEQRVRMTGEQADAKQTEPGAKKSSEGAEQGAEVATGQSGRLIVRELRTRLKEEEEKKDRKKLLRDLDEQIQTVVESLGENDVVVVLGGADESLAKLEKLQSLLDKCEDTIMRGKIKKYIEEVKTRANDTFVVLACAAEIRRSP